LLRVDEIVETVRHVYLVSSTYEDISRNWMVSAVFDHTGTTIAQAKGWRTVAVAEVYLDQTTEWPSLGDFRAKIPGTVRSLNLSGEIDWRRPRENESVNGED
jgi:predicted amidohydrolase